MPQVNAQPNFKLLPGSGELVYDEAMGAHRLIGGANIIYQNNKMYCDSIHYYDRTQLLHAYGHVHINKEGKTNLFCDSLIYDGRTKIAKLYGHVRAVDTEYTLTTNQLDFDTRTQTGTYYTGGKIINALKGEVLTSTIGYFNPNSKNFSFRKNVRYKSNEIEMTTDTLQYIYSKSTAYFFGPTDIFTDDTQMYCEDGWYNTDTQEGSLRRNAKILQDSKIIQGDTLNYYPSIKQSEGLGNVFYSDTNENLSFKGDYALIDDSLYFSLLTGHALAIKKQDKDTLYIHADTLYNQNDSLGNRVITKGYHNVRIFGNTMQGRADSLSYSDTSNIIELYKDPIIWSKNGELKGDFISMTMNDSTLEKLNIYSNATILMEVDSALYYNQIAGKDIVAYFNGEEISSALVKGNAKTIFFPTTEEKTDSTFTIKRMGMNRLYASKIKVFLDSGEVQSINYYDQPDGMFYPIDEIDTKEQFIENFDWNDALRPRELEDVFKRD